MPPKKKENAPSKKNQEKKKDRVIEVRECGSAIGFEYLLKMFWALFGKPSRPLCRSILLHVLLQDVNIITCATRRFTKSYRSK